MPSHSSVGGAGGPSLSLVVGTSSFRHWEQRNQCKPMRFAAHCPSEPASFYFSVFLFCFSFRILVKRFVTRRARGFAIVGACSADRDHNSINQSMVESKTVRPVPALGAVAGDIGDTDAATTSQIISHCNVEQLRFIEDSTYDAVSWRGLGFGWWLGFG